MAWPLKHFSSPLISTVFPCGLMTLSSAHSPLVSSRTWKVSFQLKLYVSICDRKLDLLGCCVFGQSSVVKLIFHGEKSPAHVPLGHVRHPIFLFSVAIVGDLATVRQYAVAPRPAVRNAVLFASHRFRGPWAAATLGCCNCKLGHLAALQSTQIGNVIKELVTFKMIAAKGRPKWRTLSTAMVSHCSIFRRSIQ